MKNFKLLCIIIACANIFAACKKDKTNVEPADQLPLATQTGANTFGCLVNGELFINKGADGNNSNYRLTVDPNFQNGSLQIRVYSLQNNKYKKININSNNINSVGTYNVFGNGGPLFIDFINENTQCSFNQNINCYLNGRLIVTRYDIFNGIFSGSFEFKLKDPSYNCDTIRITEGRFDKKL